MVIKIQAVAISIMRSYYIHQKTYKLTTLYSEPTTDKLDKQSSFLSSLLLFFGEQIIFLIAMLSCLRELGKFYFSRLSMDLKAFNTRMSNYYLEIRKQIYDSKPTQLACIFLKQREKTDNVIH